MHKINRKIMEDIMYVLTFELLNKNYNLFRITMK